MFSINHILAEMYLSRDANEQKPFLLCISAVVDDLAASQAGMAVKDLHRL